MLRDATDSVFRQHHIEERQSEFECTKNLLENLPVAYFHVFPFSARKGTRAFSIEDQVLPSVKQKRGEELRKLSIQKRYDFHDQFLGKIRKVLWESPDSKGNISGYTDNYIRVTLNEKNCYDFQNQNIKQFHQFDRGAC